MKYLPLEIGKIRLIYLKDGLFYYLAIAQQPVLPDICTNYMSRAFLFLFKLHFQVCFYA